MVSPGLDFGNHRVENRGMNNIKALPGNAPELWERFEQHSECPTIATEIGGGIFVLGCTEHQVKHLLAKEEAGA